MSPSYHNMQIVILDRHSDTYTYGDVIAFQCDNLNAVLIKRIVGCPGDKVIIEGRHLYVNDVMSVVFPQEYLFEYAGTAEDIMCLADDQYFVIGDNIDGSKDSRFLEVGNVSRKDILGKLIK